MAHFIAAVHTLDGQPTAFALVEQIPGGRSARYAVRRLHPLGGEDPVRHVLDDLAAAQEYVGRTTLVVTGGQKAADRFHDAGPSAVPVTLTGPDSTAGTDTLAVPAQVLVDTFERVLRDGDVAFPGALDYASEALDALYAAADLEAIAPDAEEEETTEAMSGDVYPARADSPTTVEQSGGEAAVSTGVVGDRRKSRATEMLGTEVERPPRGRVAASTDTRPDLGEHEGVALALALATWYGEYTADALPVTDQADEV